MTRPRGQQVAAQGLQELVRPDLTQHDAHAEGLSRSRCEALALCHGEAISSQHCESEDRGLDILSQISFMAQQVR